MAVVTVAADNLRADSMDSTTNVTDIGGGAGAAAEPDIFYQGAGAVSRKIGTAQRGFFTSTGAERNMSVARRNVVLMKVAIGNWSALDPQTTPGLVLYVGSDASNRREYAQSLFSNYQAEGGFMIFAIDPSVAGHANTTIGTPVITALDYFGLQADFSAVSKAENVVMDSVDIGAGLNLVGGDGADADGIFKDFIDYDYGTVANRFGYVTSKGNIPFVYGTLWIGQNTSQAAVATVFNDSGAVVVWNNGLFNAGFSGLKFDLGNANTDITLNSCVLIGRGTSGGVVDTRPVFSVTGTLGVASISGTSFQSFASLTMNSKITGNNLVISKSGIITPNGANISGSVISGATGTTAILYNNTANPVGLLDNLILTSSGTGHAIELGSNTPTSITFSNHSYFGYASINGSTGNEVLYNNSGKAITVNYDGDAPTVRNGAGSSTTLVNSITWTFNVVDEEGNDVQNAEVTITDGAASPTELYHLENTPATGLAVYSFDGVNAGNNATVLVLKSGTNPKEPFALDTIHPSSNTTTTLQLRDDRTEINPI